MILRCDTLLQTIRMILIIISIIRVHYRKIAAIIANHIEPSRIRVHVLLNLWLLLLVQIGFLWEIYIITRRSLVMRSIINLVRRVGIIVLVLLCYVADFTLSGLMLLFLSDWLVLVVVIVLVLNWLRSEWVFFIAVAISSGIKLWIITLRIAMSLQTILRDIVAIKYTMTLAECPTSTRLSVMCFAWLEINLIFSIILGGSWLLLILYNMTVRSISWTYRFSQWKLILGIYT